MAFQRLGTMYTIQYIIFIPSLRCKISGFSDWIYAVLNMFESPCLALFIYQFIEGLVKNTNLQKDWLKTCEDIAFQRLDTVYNILNIQYIYIIYVHGQMSQTLQSPWTLSRPITSTGVKHIKSYILKKVHLNLITRS